MKHITLLLSILNVILVNGTPLTRAKPAKDYGTFWQLTDVHVELAYNEHGDIARQCRKWFADKGSARAHGRPDGPYGDQNCDSPLLLANLSVQAMKSIQAKPDFIIWTGDNGPHLPRESSSLEGTLKAIETVTNLLNETFPGIPIFPCLGNHDVFPNDYLSLNKSKIFYKSLQKLWAQWIPKDQVDNFLKGGYFYANILPKLDLVSLNTVLLMRTNTAAGANGTDPNGQLSWLNQIMLSSHQRGHKVIVIAHVPPGASESSPTLMPPFLHDAANAGLLSAIQPYSAQVLTAAIFAHEHVDTFRVIYDASGKTPVGSVFLAPSVTPFRLHGLGSPSPSIRLYNFNREDGSMLDYHQYHLNLTAANLEPDIVSTANWTLEYSATKAYNLKDLSPSNMHSLVTKFRANDSKEFATYINFHLSGQAHEYNTSTKFSKCWQLCGITQLDIAAHNSCLAACPKSSPNWPWDDSDFISTPLTTTTDSVNISRRHHHHGHGRMVKVVPWYMQYVIIGMSVALVILLLIVIVLCLCKNPSYMRPHYVRVISVNDS